MPNRLAHETSPYLLQHANNPVDWYPWGEEALARARREDKPIFLSIGYAACHWCHVMERESFEHADVAALLNREFVSIKVDREERPDLDEIYMAATVAVSGGGGWPMSVFLDTEQRPFFAGTYFPPVERWGKPSFRGLCERIAELWKTERSTLAKHAAELVSHVRAEFELEATARVESDAALGAVRELTRTFDARYGGFGAAPKFPPSAALALLLRRHHASGDEGALAMVKKTLDGMKDGGMYDQLGGGFARYSTDERWLVPHFEKMLYDNAELARVYLDAFQVTADPEYRRVARETLDYVAREMQSAAGGYFSATDADSEGVEGKYFVWTLDEIQAALPRDAAEHFAFFYDVTPEGNWEERSVLHRTRTLAEAASALGLTPDALERSLAESRAALLAVRAERVPPLLDDKVITAWNGLMIGAMAEGFRVLRDRRYLASAERAARHALEKLRRPDGGLFRTLRDGRAHLDGYLEDYAFLGDALVTLYEAGSDASFLERALELAERLLRDFGDAGGGFFGTAAQHESLVARPKDTHDGALPSANAVAARLLVRLGRHFDRPELVERAREAVEAYGEFVRRAPRAFATSLGVIELIEAAPVELAVVGDPGSPEREALEAALASHYLPHRIVAHAPGPTPATSPLPLLRDKAPVGGHAALYVCSGYVCAAPITDPNAVAAALRG
ncbi:MAG TPA: thioredoxin domain-containing protein [Polyangiaceae bacterium]|nr:thioredoxin domain-containing protein [Polyangiaceae bacterium]